MVWVESLSLQTWFVQILSGSAQYFAAVAIFALIVFAGYLRMTGLTIGFMALVFLLMFSGYMPMSLIVFIAIFSGLIVGWVISRVVRY